MSRDAGAGAGGGPARGSTAVAIRSVTKRYGSVTALASVDLDVETGQLLTLLGPSGSGKSTLLKVVAGFEVPDGGSVLLTGEDITWTPPAKRNIGMVFQNYTLFPHMTVAENLAFPLEMRRTPKRDIRERIGRALEMVELRGFEQRLPRQLSGGQQQRVALARAIVFDPRLLLLDEPFGALDRKLREALQLEVRRLQHRLGLTTLFVTHDQEEALILSDRIAVMNEGRIEQVGRPAEIYTRPANWFVADFIGESNLFRGSIAEVAGGACRVALDAGPTVAVHADPVRRPGDTVGVVIKSERPRRLAALADAPNAFPARVLESVYLGQAHKYRLALEGGLELIVRWPTTGDGGLLEPGATFLVGWFGDDARLVAL